VLLLVTAAAACREDPRPETWWVSMHQDGVDVGVERLQPGPERPPPQAWRMREMPVQNPYEGNRRSIAEGRRLYRWMNCIDCHGEGGGSIGPTLWDDQWIYGGRPIDIFESIYYGRPDGMPAYGGHLPADQIWLLVSYVRSLEPRGGLYNEGVK
jgi:mono/diheme cytochrome c family protein